MKRHSEEYLPSEDIQVLRYLNASTDPLTLKGILAANQQEINQGTPIAVLEYAQISRILVRLRNAAFVDWKHGHIWEYTITKKGRECLTKEEMRLEQKNPLPLPVRTPNWTERIAAVTESGQAATISLQRKLKIRLSPLKLKILALVADQNNGMKLESIKNALAGECASYTISNSVTHLANLELLDSKTRGVYHITLSGQEAMELATSQEQVSWTQKIGSAPANNLRYDPTATTRINTHDMSFRELK